MEAATYTVVVAATAAKEVVEGTGLVAGSEDEEVTAVM